jgi:hypothetical protein
MTATVVSLLRYPVKSMMGEELNAALLTDKGLTGDRAYALVDAETGKVASAKNPKVWPNLFEFRASFVEPPQPGASLPPVRITLPDGELVRSDEPDADERLSRAVGRRVTLASTAPSEAALEEYWPDLEGLAPQGHRDTVTEEQVAGAAPPGTFFDLAPIHVLTTATIDRLRELYPAGRFEVRRFRPNLVVRVDEEGFVENSWLGRTLAVGADAKLPVILPVPRCVMTTLPQGDLPKDSGILRTAAQHNRIDVAGTGLYPCVGVYAGVAAGGTLRRGDSVHLS